MPKCQYPDGFKILPDGEHELDPCVYETAAVIHNVTVEVLRCKACGHVEVSWYRQDDTYEEENDGF